MLEGCLGSREAAEQRFWERAMQPVEGRLAMWATVLKADGRYIGRCGLYPNIEGEAEGRRMRRYLGFYLARAFWGRGFASEAGRAFVEFGFDELKLDADCHCGSGRKRSVGPCPGEARVCHCRVTR